MKHSLRFVVVAIRSSILVQTLKISKPMAMAVEPFKQKSHTMQNVYRH